MSRARSKRQAALAPIAEDEPVAEEQPGPVAEIMALIDGLDAAGGCPQAGGDQGSRAQRPTAPSLPPCAVEERVASLMSAAEDAVLQLKNECKRLLVLLPAKVRRRRQAQLGWLALAWLLQSWLEHRGLHTICLVSQLQSSPLAAMHPTQPTFCRPSRTRRRARCSWQTSKRPSLETCRRGRWRRSGSGAPPWRPRQQRRQCPPPAAAAAPPPSVAPSQRRCCARCGRGVGRWHHHRSSARPRLQQQRLRPAAGAARGRGWVAAQRRSRRQQRSSSSSHPVRGHVHWLLAGLFKANVPLPLECGLNCISPCSHVSLQRWPLGGAVQLLPPRLQPLACLAGCRCRHPCRLLARRWRCPSPCSHKSAAAAPRRYLCRTQPL